MSLLLYRLPQNSASLYQSIRCLTSSVVSAFRTARRRNLPNSSSQQQQEDEGQVLTAGVQKCSLLVHVHAVGSVHILSPACRAVLVYAIGRFISFYLHVVHFPFTQEAASHSLSPTRMHTFSSAVGSATFSFTCMSCTLSFQK